MTKETLLETPVLQQVTLTESKSPILNTNIEPEDQILDKNKSLNCIEKYDHITAQTKEV